MEVTPDRVFGSESLRPFSFCKRRTLYPLRDPVLVSSMPRLRVLHDSPENLRSGTKLSFIKLRKTWEEDGSGSIYFYPEFLIRSSSFSLFTLFPLFLFPSLLVHCLFSFISFFPPSLLAIFLPSFFQVFIP